jgi:hypothetical protein
MTLEERKQELFNDLTSRLGGNIIDLECGPEDFEAAFKYAVRVYRQRAQNSTQETYTLFTTHAHVNTYTMPDNFVNIRSLFRRTVGLDTGPSSSSFDPFSSAILNTYLLNYNMSGGLATYDLYAGYIELAARMFGGYVNYTFNPVTKVLNIVRDPKSDGEQILIWADMMRSEDELLQNPSTSTWIMDWCLSVLKNTIGEAREKFAQVAGPSGGTSLNGAAMKADAVRMQEALIKDLAMYVDGSQPLTWVQG